MGSISFSFCLTYVRERGILCVNASCGLQRMGENDGRICVTALNPLQMVKWEAPIIARNAESRRVKHCPFRAHLSVKSIK